MMRDWVPWPAEFADRYRREGYWAGQPLGTLLRASCARHADRVALVHDDRRLTYRDLAERSGRLAARLHSLGVRPTDRVVVQLPNVPEFAVLLLALLHVGAIPVLALPGHRRVEITHLCAHSGAVALAIVDRFRGVDYRQVAREVRPGAPDLRHVLVAGDAQEFTGWEGGDVVPEPHRPDPGEPALMLLSGGTTGLPKLIPRTHDDYAYNARATAEALQFGADGVYLAVNPLGHNSALGCPGLLGALLVGGTVVLTSGVRPDEVFALVRRERVTLTTVVPSVLRLWLDAAERTGTRLPDLLLQVGSAKLDPAWAGRVRDVLGSRLSQWFGIGEGLLTHTRLDDPDEVVAGTEGRPLAAADEIRVVDPDGRPVPAGEVGELLTRGPYTVRGYYRAPERNAESFTEDGFFRTGDLVLVRTDGNLVVVGRLKDVVNRAGEKVPAAEVEEHLLTHPGVLDAAVVGIDDPVLGERAVAFVVPRGDGLDAAAVKRYLRECGLAVFKVPDRVVPVTGLPRTAVGKVDKVALRASVASMP